MKQRAVRRGACVVAEDDSSVVLNRGKGGFLIRKKDSSRINNMNNHTIILDKISQGYVGMLKFV